MKGIKHCAYNMDSGTIDIIWENDTAVSLLCSQIEKELDTTILTRSRLDWLIDNEPLTYAKLVLSGEIQSYLSQYAKDQTEQENNIRQQLEKHYPPETAREIAREFMMYDSE
ncbi:MAG: hypothetical protein GX800_06265 [Clostridiaceae bacterium]|jgi:hypothetical protein|nr:hypothetical protein [Clostridiaceae bacterium]